MTSSAFGDPSTGDRPKPAWREVIWEGEVDMAVAPTMLARVFDGAHDDYVVVDLSAVQFMDASGLGALIKARRLLRAGNGDLLVRHPSSTVRWMLGHFDLSDLIEPEQQPGPSQAGHRTGVEQKSPIVRLQARPVDSSSAPAKTVKEPPGPPQCQTVCLRADLAV